MLKRGNVVWIDFGFNIGNEFGGMHPAIILKNFDNEIFVLPISSKKPKEYKKLEQDYHNKKITLEECVREKEQITEIVQIDNIYRFKEMIRWTNIIRMKKVSVLRLNFSGAIGKADGKYLSMKNRNRVLWIEHWIYSIISIRKWFIEIAVVGMKVPVNLLWKATS